MGLEARGGRLPAKVFSDQMQNSDFMKRRLSGTSIAQPAKVDGLLENPRKRL